MTLPREDDDSMSTHYPERPVRWQAQRTFLGVWSRQPANKAVVFVHGYGGGATSTWKDFQTLLPTRPEAAGHDLIFYEYDGLRSNVGASAAIFRDFLGRLTEDPSSWINPTVPASARRPGGARYDSVLLVAHSLGAVISRRALLDGMLAEEPWPARTRLVLFAPAHSGAKVSELASTIRFGSWNGFLFGALRFASPLIDELNPTSSVLTTLRQETAAALRQERRDYLVALKVILGERDNIVESGRFCDDPAPIAFIGKSHTAVCKPTPRFLEPINAVVALL